MVVRVNTTDSLVEWRWINMLWVAIGAFVLSIIWRWAMARRQLKSKKAEQGEEELVKPVRLLGISISNLFNESSEVFLQLKLPLVFK